MLKTANDVLGEVNVVGRHAYTALSVEAQRGGLVGDALRRAAERLYRGDRSIGVTRRRPFSAARLRALADECALIRSADLAKLIRRTEAMGAMGLEALLQTLRRSGF